MHISREAPSHTFEPGCSSASAWELFWAQILCGSSGSTSGSSHPLPLWSGSNQLPASSNMAAEPREVVCILCCGRQAQSGFWCLLQWGLKQLLASAAVAARSRLAPCDSGCQLYRQVCCGPVCRQHFYLGGNVTPPIFCDCRFFCKYSSLQKNLFSNDVALIHRFRYPQIFFWGGGHIDIHNRISWCSILELL